jgi:hypothetical protein
MVVYNVQRSRAQQSEHAALLHAYGQRCGWQPLAAPAELDDSQVVRCAADQLARQLHANLARMLAEPVLLGFVTSTIQLVRACCCPRRPRMCVCMLAVRACMRACVRVRVCECMLLACPTRGTQVFWRPMRSPCH